MEPIVPCLIIQGVVVPRKNLSHATECDNDFLSPEKVVVKGPLIYDENVADSIYHYKCFRASSLGCLFRAGCFENV